MRLIFHPHKTKKAVFLFAAFVLLVLTSIPLFAWKPSQHVAFGLRILHELQAGNNSGTVEINGVFYQINPSAKIAIINNPTHYLMGCVGPDAYADIYFGQCVVHPDTFWTDDSPHSISDNWFRPLLQFARYKFVAADPEINDGGKALAFAYGFITHAAGDMWGHTFMNKYAGGVWPSILKYGLTIPIRHLAVEGYVDHITGSIGRDGISALDLLAYSWDRDIHDFIYWVFFANDYTSQFDSGKFFNFFRSMKTFLSETAPGLDWVKEFEEGLPDDARLSTKYLNHWISAIDDGIKKWIRVSTKVAHQIFIDGDWEEASEALQEWAQESLPEMLGEPPGFDQIREFFLLLNKDINSIKDKVLESQPLAGLIDFQTDIRNWLFESLFGISIGDLKEYWQNPETYLGSPAWFAEAPFGLNTQAELDKELAFSLGYDEGGSGEGGGGGPVGTFDPMKFDASFNSIMMGKLLLLDGPTLNQLLANHGYSGEPLYGIGELEDAQMCAMLGFMRSLDADHQWMIQSPDGEEWGGGERIDGVPTGSMRMWENEEARERAFKKIFHTGLDMNITTPQPLVLTPGTPEMLEIEVINTENRKDCFSFSMSGLNGSVPFQISLNNMSEVSPGYPETIEIGITAPRDCSLAAGQYSYTVIGQSIGRIWAPYDDPPEKSEMGSVIVLPFYEPDITVSPGSQTTMPGGLKTYDLGLENDGNIADVIGLSLTLEDFDGAYDAYPTSLQPGWVSIGGTSFELSNCDSQSTPLSIHIPVDWAGMEAATYRAIITAQSSGDPGAQDTAVATIVVEPTKASMARYIDLELLELKDLVSSSIINQDIRASLLDHLISAIKKKEQGLGYILEGRINQANNMLNACQEIVKAFINLAEAQKGKAIDPTTADLWIVKAQTIRGHIGTTISTR